MDSQKFKTEICTSSNCGSYEDGAGADGECGDLEDLFGDPVVLCCLRGSSRRSAWNRWSEMDRKPRLE